MHRYAVYYAPPAGSPLAEWAAAWLGRDPDCDEPRPQPEVTGLTRERLAELTRSPRRYGFHATLKAPMTLAEGRDGADLHAAVAALAARFRPFSFALELASLGGFLALVPSERSPELQALERACVTELDPLRAPPTAAELDRRLRGPLTLEERAHLQRWGYPYVLDRFRFHLTLTERLHEPEHGLLLSRLRTLTEPWTAHPLPIDALSVFEQPDESASFTVTARYSLCQKG